MQAPANKSKQAAHRPATLRIRAARPDELRILVDIDDEASELYEQAALPIRISALPWSADLTLRADSDLPWNRYGIS